jgi:hypothetical protein
MEHLYLDIPLDSSFNERSKDIRCLASKINSLSTNLDNLFIVFFFFLESVQPPLFFLFLFFKLIKG